jgi:hypothetical protein
MMSNQSSVGSVGDAGSAAGEPFAFISELLETLEARGKSQIGTRKTFG